MTLGRAQLARCAPAAVSALALGGVVWWAGHQQLPALPSGRDQLAALAGAVALYALATLVRCERWHRLLALSGVPSNRADDYGLVTVGYMANNTLIARAGDVLKVVLSAARSGASTTRIAGLAIGERVLDALALLMLFVLSGLLSPRLGFTGSGALLRDAAIAGVAGLALVIAAVLVRRTRLAARVRREVLEAAGALRPLAGRPAAALLAMSLALWLAESGVYLAVGRAVDVQIGLLGCVQIVALVNLIGLIPAAPANLGTFDAAVLFATRGLSSAGGALAYVLVLRLVLFVPITLVGLIVLLTRHGGLSRLRLQRPLSSTT